VSDEAQLFRDAAAQERLLAQRCATCGKASLPPAPSCLHCGSPDVTHVDAATSGSLRTWTVTHVAFDPAFAGELPYVVGVVDLDDGARLLGMVDVPHERLADGLRLSVTWRRSPVDDEPVWAFAEVPG
jgi:uncharacterized OB-fold protein